MQKEEAQAAINEMARDGHSRKFIKDYLETENVPGSTAYRWINEILPTNNEQKRIGDIALDTLKDLLDRAIAVEDLESQERIAMLLVNAAAKLKRA
jgi:predicted membrane chloride channel (bestrophin family)